jgi:pentatricopeptide repeat protein
MKGKNETTPAPKVSDLLVTVKSREIQRGMLAEWRGDRADAALHLMAAGHLELVLAEDYAVAGSARDALRSKLSAASCFWRGGEIGKARELFDQMRKKNRKQAKVISETLAELERDFPEEGTNRKTRKKA